MVELIINYERWCCGWLHSSRKTKIRKSYFNRKSSSFQQIKKEVMEARLSGVSYNQAY